METRDGVQVTERSLVFGKTTSGQIVEGVVVMVSGSSARVKFFGIKGVRKTENLWNDKKNIPREYNHFTDDGDVGRDLTAELRAIKNAKRNYGC
jgi:ribosomal protein S1